MPSKSKVCFFFERKDFILENRLKLKAFIESLFKKEKKKLILINYIFCSEKKLLEINRRFLGHDFYTDIITFDLSESANIEAEVYISINRVKENAKFLGIEFNHELHRVIFHGALHLCNYNDKKERDKEKMRKAENFYLKKYFK